MRTIAFFVVCVVLSMNEIEALDLIGAFSLAFANGANISHAKPKQSYSMRTISRTELRRAHLRIWRRQDSSRKTELSGGSEERYEVVQGDLVSGRKKSASTDEIAPLAARSPE